MDCGPGDLLGIYWPAPYPLFATLGYCLAFFLSSPTVTGNITHFPLLTIQGSSWTQVAIGLSVNPLQMASKTKLPLYETLVIDLSCHPQAFVLSLSPEHTYNLPVWVFLVVFIMLHWGGKGFSFSVAGACLYKVGFTVF